MCLGTKLSDGSLQRYKAKGKKMGYIRVWKVVCQRYRKYIPEMDFNRVTGLHKAGFNHAKKKATQDDELIHAFRNRKSAKRWITGESGKIIIACMICPEWANAIGSHGYNGHIESLTTKAIVMPKYPKRKVIVKEFRAAIKGRKIKKYSWE